MSVSSPTKLDLILELWKAHGIFALGWVFTCFLALYIVLLHRRMDSIYKEYIKALTAANATVIPLVDKSVAVMSHVVAVIDGAVERASERDGLMQGAVTLMTELKGKVEIVIQTFIEERHFTETAALRGGELARKKVTKEKGKGGVVRDDSGDGSAE